MTVTVWLSLLLAIIGVTGIAFAGHGGWKGWAINLSGQPAWGVFAVITHAWPLLLSTVAYTAVFAVNLNREWVRAGHRSFLPRRNRVRIVNPAPYLPTTDRIGRALKNTTTVFCHAVLPPEQQQHVIEIRNGDVTAITRCYEPAGHDRGRLAAHHCLILGAYGQSTWQWMAAATAKRVLAA